MGCDWILKPAGDAALWRRRGWAVHSYTRIMPHARSGAPDPKQRLRDVVILYRPRRAGAARLPEAA